MQGIIYEYKNIKTNVFYIGQTRVSLKKRDWQHRNSHTKNNSYFDNVYRKHPEDFILSVLVTIDTEHKKHLINALNFLEVSYIALAKQNGKALYNILPGGNNSWRDVPPTENMLKALDNGRLLKNKRASQNKFSSEEVRIRHNKQSKEYTQRHPEQYKKTYTEANNKRKEYKRQWYQAHKEEMLAKCRLRYEQKKDEILANSKKYYQTDKQKIRKQQNSRRKAHVQTNLLQS